MKKKLFRSNKDKILTGLCGGVAEYFGINSGIIRLIVIFLSVGSVGTGIIVYFIASFIIAEEGTDRIEAEFVDADDKQNK